MMISVKGLTKYYGPRLAVDHITMDVPKGQIVGILGPNGAGKTTTIRMLTCFMPATSGEAKINGLDVFTQSKEVRRNIGYLPENTPLYPEMRVEQQLHFFGKLHGMDKAARTKRIADLTERCSLTEILRRPIGQLSKGNRQRVGLAQALMHDPPVVILDEPTEGLDPTQIAHVRELIQDLAREKTVLLSTHILPEVERTCHRVVIIQRGRMVADGSPDELKQKVRSSSRVILEVKAPGDEVAKALGQISQVGKVETVADNGWTRAAVTPRQAGGDIRELLGDAVIAKRWPMRTMTHERASLEEYFVQVTSGEQTHAH